MPKYFTVEEANRTLPLVRRIVEDIVKTYEELTERVAEARQTSPGGGDEAETPPELEAEIRELTDRTNGYIAELDELSALFKGPEEGLVDFYAMLDERPVFLCWKLGEEQIEYWHELEAGYAGRQRLPAHLLSAGGAE